MYLEQPATKEAILKIIKSITHCSALQDDLLQEALIHLWLMETRRPGQTHSWYLQSCKYHLLHYLASGCSVDSAKREGRSLQPPEDSADEEGHSKQRHTRNPVFTLVRGREIVSES